jgi:hypothetical protein
MKNLSYRFLSRILTSRNSVSIRLNSCTEAKLEKRFIFYHQFVSSNSNSEFSQRFWKPSPNFYTLKRIKKRTD